MKGAGARLKFTLYAGNEVSILSQPCSCCTPCANSGQTITTLAHMAQMCDVADAPLRVPTACRMAQMCDVADAPLRVPTVC
jgi:hypothetical protein